MKPYFPVKEGCLDWQKLILQIQIQIQNAKILSISAIMCRKQKLSRVFGRALGRRRKIERQKHVGRPIYQVKHSRKRRNENLKITIRKLHRFYNKE